MSRVSKNLDNKYTRRLFKTGDTVYVKGARGIDSTPYRIYSVTDDESYRLSWNGHLQGRVYRYEDLWANPEVSRKISSVVIPKAKSSTGASQANADKDHTTVHLGNAVVQRDDQDSSERVAAINGPSTKPVKQEASEFDPSIAHEKTELDGLKSPIGEIKMEDIAQDMPLAKPEFGIKEVLVEGSAEVNPPTWVPCHSHEEDRWKNLRKMLSKFGPGERPLVDGKKRVRWQCRCGRSGYDDFIELRSGAAAELEKWLNDSMKKHAGSSAPNSQQSATLTSAISPIAGPSGYQQTAESDISLQSLSPSNNVPRAPKLNAAVSIDVNLDNCWLILCGNMKRGPNVLLTQLNMSSTTSDKSLFDDMKSVYSSFRQPWTIRSVLRGVKTIRFVQFQLHKSARVDIRKAPDVPPETRRDEYLYEPCDLIPPVGEDFMTHWFHHPEDAWEFPWAYSLIPKRLKGELEVNLNQAPRVGWGIQIVEGWLGSRLWLLSLSLFVCGSLAFAICRTILEHDIQGAFAVSAYVVALLTLAVGAAHSNLG